MQPIRRNLLKSLAIFTAAAAVNPKPALADEAEVIDARVGLALSALYTSVEGSRELAAQARGMLIMPSVVKGGFIVGGSYGEGALRLPEDGYTRSVAYYSVAAASIGLQAGVQKTSHVLFFLTDTALEKFRRSDGWELGADAEFTVPDAGMNVGVDTTAYRKPVIAVMFGASGLLLGASLEGAKYSRIQR
jgi:lipid-binding SYLF domain-containing protein